MITNSMEIPEPSRRAAYWRPVLLLAAIAGVLVGSYLAGVGGRLQELREWIHSLGWLGPIAFALIYGLAATAALPASMMSIGAGAIFGSVVGVVSVSAGSALASALSYVLARYLARDAVVAWLGDKPRFRQLDELTESRGTIVVALVRLVPLFPFSLVNYGLGLTRVPFGTYLFWSWLCMVPATIVYVVSGAGIVQGLIEGRVPLLLVGVVIATAVLLWFLIRYARRALQADPPPEADEQEKPSP